MRSSYGFFIISVSLHLKQYKTIIGMAESGIDFVKYDRLLNRLKVISHPDRMAIIEFLQNKDKASVTEILSNLNLVRNLTSIHLKLLRDQHLVISKRSAHKIYYSINHAVLSELINSINRCV